MYKLTLEINDKKVVLMDQPLKMVDKFTVAYKNEDELIDDVMPNELKQNVKKLYIESPRGTKYHFIGSTISNVVDDFESEEYINKLCSLASDYQTFPIIKKYFEEQIEERVLNNSQSKEEYDVKKAEYMKKNDIPAVKIIKSYDEINKLNEEDSREVKNKINSLFVEVLYNLRQINSNYNDYRNLYAFIVSNGFYSQKAHLNNEEFIKETEAKIKNVIENELIYKQESFIQNENNEVVLNQDKEEEEEDIDLTFIEHNEENTNYNPTNDDTYYPETIINNPLMTAEEKEEELNKYVENKDEVNYYMRKVHQG